MYRRYFSSLPRAGTVTETSIRGLDNVQSFVVDFYLDLCRNILLSFFSMVGRNEHNPGLSFHFCNDRCGDFDNYFLEGTETFKVMRSITWEKELMQHEHTPPSIRR